MDQAMLTVAALGLLGFGCQWVAWKSKLPAIVYLLISGVLIGPVLGLFNPDEFLGDFLFPFVSLSVAIILFEGSLTLDLGEIKKAEGKVVWKSLSSGLLITWAVISLAGYFLVGFDWRLALLFGAILVVTGPTVIAPMLQVVRPTHNIARILQWEGVIIDPIGAMLAVLVYNFIVITTEPGSAAWGHVALVFGKLLLVSCVIGVVAGYVFGLALRKFWIPEFLHNAATLAVIIGAFTLANTMQHEAGLLTVTIMGIWLRNMRDVDIADILTFKETLSVILISGLFIVLAARLDLQQVMDLGWVALAIFAVVQFIARPLKVWVSTFGSDFTRSEKLLLSWIAPRGIVAAAVSALFALRLSDAGIEQAELLVPLTFIVIIGTVVLQGFTAGALAKWLGVQRPEASGILIIGGNPVALAVAEALKNANVQVLVTDSEWKHINAARNVGVDTYFGSPVSTHADTYLMLDGIGRMMALSNDDKLNSIASMKFRTVFGPDKIYVLQTTLESSGCEKDTITAKFKGKRLFGEKVSYRRLEEMFEENAQVHTIRFTEQFTYEQFLELRSEDCVSLFAIDEDKEIHFFLANQSPKPRKGWTLAFVSRSTLNVDDDEAADTGEFNDDAVEAFQRDEASNLLAGDSQTSDALVTNPKADDELKKDASKKDILEKDKDVFKKNT